MPIEDAAMMQGNAGIERDPTNPAPAEEAFLTSIAIAQQQKAKSFELRAALALPKLYQSINRAADAHAVLTPALEGFSATPELPDIEEAQRLLAALVETDEVKNAAAFRQRRLKLQTSYGQAVMWSKGFSSGETKAAFLRVQELAAGVNNPERFAAYYGLWIGSLMRGALELARETGETFRREAVKQNLMPEAAAANRCLGLTCLIQGDLTAAQAHLGKRCGLAVPNGIKKRKFALGQTLVRLPWPTLPRQCGSSASLDRRER
jgi:hypothetical protein